MNVEINDKDIEDITPYIEALSFFEQIKDITNNFPNKYGITNIKKFIECFKKYVEINKNDDCAQQREKEYIQKTPQKIFYFFLDELHKYFKDNNEDNKTIKAVEYDREKAIKYNDDFREKDKSIISELFFGNKLITKKCKNCNMTLYDCRYLKVIPLDIRNISGELGLETQLYESIIMEDQRNLFCQMCSDYKDLNVSIKPIMKPQILIIIISYYNPGTRINIPYTIFNDSYKLISAEVECDNSNFFKSKSKKNYKLFYNKHSTKFNGIKSKDTLNSHQLPKGNPYVLFYEKISNYPKEVSSEDILNKNEIDIIPTQNDKTNDIIIEKKYYNNSNLELNNKKQIISKSTNPSNSLINNYNSIGNQTEHDSNDILSGDIKDITLIFKFENEKEFYIKTNDCQQFKYIISMLIDKYKNEMEKNVINENNLYYCNKKIKMNETPKDLGIEEEKAYIYVR